jgi:hypothetical protein
MQTVTMQRKGLKPMSSNDSQAAKQRVLNKLEIAEFKRWTKAAIAAMKASKNGSPEDGASKDAKAAYKKVLANNIKIYSDQRKSALDKLRMDLAARLQWAKDRNAAAKKNSIPTPTSKTPKPKPTPTSKPTTTKSPVKR